MIVNLEIDEETGRKLDELADTETRTRRGQAVHLLKDAIEMIHSDIFPVPHNGETATEGVAE